MKKALFIAIIASVLSCDMKDKNDNAPLIENSDGLLVDNPEYHSKVNDQVEKTVGNFEERAAENKKNRAKRLKELTSADTISVDPVIAREHFAETFKPTTGSNKTTLSGKGKTTVTFTGAFNDDYTPEQFARLGYLTKLENLGFKIVIFSNGNKTVATRKF